MLGVGFWAQGLRVQGLGSATYALGRFSIQGFGGCRGVEDFGLRMTPLVGFEPYRSESLRISWHFRV